MMNFELRVIAGCPHSAPAAELFRRALDDEGLGPGQLQIRELTSEQEARELEFHGSPGFVVSGRDVFVSHAEPALSCRVYPTSAGIAGLPSLVQLRTALRGTSTGTAL